MSFLWGWSDGNVCVKMARHATMKDVSQVIPVTHLEHVDSEHLGNYSSQIPRNDWDYWITNFNDLPWRSENSDDWGRTVAFDEVKL
jgi:hypothetical protein